MSRLALAILLVLSTASDAPDAGRCDIPNELKDARGCVSLPVVEELARRQCNLPNGFCFSINYEEAATRVMVVDVTGKGASRMRAQAEAICRSLSRDQKVTCRLGLLKETESAVRIQVRSVLE